MEVKWIEKLNAGKIKFEITLERKLMRFGQEEVLFKMFWIKKKRGCKHRWKTYGLLVAFSWFPRQRPIYSIKSINLGLPTCYSRGAFWVFNVGAYEISWFRAANLRRAVGLEGEAFLRPFIGENWLNACRLRQWESSLHTSESTVAISRVANVIIACQAIF